MTSSSRCKVKRSAIDGASNLALFDPAVSYTMPQTSISNSRCSTMDFHVDEKDTRLLNFTTKH